MARPTAVLMRPVSLPLECGLTTSRVPALAGSGAGTLELVGLASAEPAGESAVESGEAEDDASCE